MVDETFLIDEDFDNFIIGGKKRRSCVNEAMKRGKNKKQAKIECNTQMGGSAIGRGVKKVQLAIPRGAFLSLVRLNYRGIASKLIRAKNEQPTEYARAVRKWKFLGGEEKNLLSTAEKGAKQKPLACGKNCLQKFNLKKSNFSNFIEYTDDEIVFIDENPDYSFSYADPVITPTLITTAGAVLVAMLGALATVVASKNKKQADAEIQADIESQATEDKLLAEKEAIERKRKNNIIIGSVIVATLLIVGGILIFGNKKNK